ncbi:carbohydrate kinase family protein [Paenibacillus montanisoli]|uniref:Carbohydrate kinase PfkB domain-containing protein n=1 Tax=Paenibacillus montanisoli TaxID=2081970 RepID=A0A328U1D3_9BACL|nr:PfkB family carbohydrate kinase [Paenibacillus montanisoli]RAP76577.1 hypothetical protein DL346_14515 [Paenibacillus montanisoli]
MSEQIPSAIIGLGSTAVDDLVYVRQYPEADSKMPVLREERDCGGLTMTALVAASRLGVKCAYAGTLGSDDLSTFVLRRLSAERIDVSRVRIEEAARPIHSTIIVDETEGTRNIFFNTASVPGASSDAPEASCIAQAKVLFIDNFGVEGMIRAAKIARQNGVAVVADFEDDQHAGFGELLQLVDHLILSYGFACRVTGCTEPQEIVERLWHSNRSLVAVTCGKEGCWFKAGSNEPVCRQEAFQVKVADTTGCGDVFHGAYAASLVMEMPATQRIRFASAAAALKATKPGGQAGSPDRYTVEQFLQQH